MIPSTFKRSMRDFVFGMEDGLVSNLGLVLGVYFGGGTAFAVILAGLASMFAGAFSMSAGSYLSSKAQREIYEHEMEHVKRSLKKNPKKYLREMGLILKKEGFNKDEIRSLLHHFERHNQGSFINSYIQKKVGITKDKLEYPLSNAITMFFSFLVGSLFPIVPFILLESSLAVMIAVILTIVVLFSVGIAKTYYTHRNWFKSGLEIVVVGLAAGIIGYLIGRLISLVV